MYTVSLSNETQLNIVFACLAVLSVIMLVFLFMQMKRKPKKMGKRELDTILAAQTDDVKTAIQAALSDMSSRLATQFEKQITSIMTNKLNDFDKQVQEAMKTSVSQYYEALVSLRTATEKELAKSEEMISSLGKELTTGIETSIQRQKQLAAKKVQENMAAIVVAYLNQSLEGNVDLTSQQDFIVSELEKNKAALLEDLKRAS